MPPEPLPWDRKDFFKERKHERSESLGSAARWRDSHQGSREFARGGSTDFRRPPGHGKQGVWHMFPEESGHGFAPSRSSDKMVEDDNSRPFTIRGEGSGKYSRNNRENRGSFSQKDWKAHSLEICNASPNMSGRSLAVNDQRSVDDMLTHSDFVNGWDQLQLKDQHDKMGGVNGLGTGLRAERESSLSSIDWKPLKWTRSGSLSSRGSGFSHSSSSKSMGVDSNEARADLQPRNVTPVQSPSGDAVACAASTTPSEETSSRKKPRLGWGEGLAKYEKKKVEGPDESVNKNGIIYCASNGESLHSLNSNLGDKSPRVMGFSDCASPATPSSVACSSSPGMEDKSFSKAGNVDNDTGNLIGSPGPVSSNHLDGFSFVLEGLELNQIANLGFSPLELVQSDDPSSVDSNFMRSTALSKLLMLKGDILKSVEMTESEIDALENELKSLKSGSGSSCPCPAASSSFPAEGETIPCEEQGAASNLILRPSPLQIVPSGDMMTDKTLLGGCAMEDAHAENKDEDIDSPGTVTSKFVESPSLVKTASPSDMVIQGERPQNLKIERSTNVEVEHLVPGPNVEGTGVSTCGGGSGLLNESKIGTPVSDDMDILIGEEDKIYSVVLASNKDCANSASEVFNKLLPPNQCQNDVLGAANFSCRQNDLLIRKKLAMRKRFLRFKEKVITLKFRVFHHLWKEDMRLLSIRKYRAKSQKKFELSSRTSHCGYQKHRSSIRARFSSPAGNLSLVPTTEILNYTSKMLSESQVKLCRNTLKMPAMILDEEEKAGSRLISRNGLVEDPCAVEKERTMINPWTAEEKEIFMDKLAIFGKDFKKIASFLDHKTTADCVEFYYKNHKSDCFEKTKKKPELRKQGKSLSATTYLVTSGKKWNREMNAASLDMLGAASVMAAHAGDSIGNLATCPGKLLLGAYHDSRTPNGDSGVLERSSSYDIIRNERETVAADVLAGICGSLSSEAMGSCITSSVDPGEGYRELKCQRMGYGVKRPWTPEVTQNIDEETCSDESCGGEMDPADWTDEEKCMFMQAVSSYGKDFAMISRCVRTRSRDQCKVFFSKARKCLGLDLIQPGPNACTPDSDDANGGGSDTEDACVVEAGSVICSNKSVSKMEEDSMLSVVNMNPDESDFSGVKNLQNNLNRSEENNGIGQVDNRDDDIVTNLVSEDSHQLEKTEQVFGDYNSLNGVDRGSLILHVEKNGPCTKIKMEMDQESVFDVVEVINPADRSNSVSPAEDCTEGREPVLPEEASLDDVRREEDNGADTNGQMPSKCTVKASSDCCPTRPNCQQQEDCVELDSEKKQPGVVVISLLHESSSSSSHMAKDSVSKDSSVIKYEKTFDQGKPLSTLDDLKETEDEDDDDKQKSSGVDLQRGQNVVINAAESAQKLGVVYPLQNHPKKEDEDRDRDRDDDLSCKNPSSAERLSKLDRYIQSSHSLAQDFYLRKCNGLRPQSSGTGTGTEVLPLISQKNLEQSSNQTRAHSRSLSDTEKPSRSGDFKLFGKILSHPSSLQKPNENDDKGAHHPKLSSRSSVNMKFTPHQSHNHNHNIDGSLSVAASKVDRNNNYLSLENLPMSYGFWDGNRLQTSFSSLPDSAILLAKYPAAFSNYPMSTTSAKAKAKMEQTVVKSSSSGNERNLSGGGMSVFPTREMNSSSSNGMIADYHHQVFRARDCTKLQPFTVDMKQQQQQQDLLFSELQRRNGFEAVSSLQAPGRRGGMVGMNIVGGGGGGGVLVGGACTPSVSDPVAAIKMHYAKAAATDQFGQGGGGSIISRDDDSWRGGGGGNGGGDIGSR